jgi:hypothetical protein
MDIHQQEPLPLQELLMRLEGLDGHREEGFLVMLHHGRRQSADREPPVRVVLASLTSDLDEVDRREEMTTLLVMVVEVPNEPDDGDFSAELASQAIQHVLLRLPGSHDAPGRVPLTRVSGVVHRTTPQEDLQLAVRVATQGDGFDGHGNRHARDRVVEPGPKRLQRIDETQEERYDHFEQVVQHRLLLASDLRGCLLHSYGRLYTIKNNIKSAITMNKTYKSNIYIFFCQYSYIT